MFGLSQRIANYKRMTTAVLQHNVDMDALSINLDTLSVAIGASTPPAFCPPDMLKAARGFGRICKPEMIPLVYLQLGVKQL